MTAPLTGIPRLTPVRLALVYAVMSGAYIVGSGLLLHGLPETRSDKIEIFKGLAFVAITALMLFGLAARLSQEIRTGQDALRQSEERYRNMFDANPAASWVYEVSSLRFLAVNKAAQAQYGYTQAEFLLMTLRSIRPEEDVPALEQAVARAPAGWIDSGIFRHRRRNGVLFPVRITSQSIMYAGTAARLVVAMDVSEVVAAREQLQILNRELHDLNESLEQRVAERTDQLARATAELEWFGEAVGHDLQQPIEHVRLLATDLVQSAGPRLTAPELEAAHRLVGATARMGMLVSELLQFAQTDPAARQLEPVSLVLVMSEALGQLARENASAGRVIVIEPLYWTLAHRPTLARVMLGILRMALPADEVTVRASRSGDHVLLVFDCVTPRLGDTERDVLLLGNAGVLSDLPRATGISIFLRSVWRLGAELTYSAEQGHGLFTLRMKFAEPR